MLTIFSICLVFSNSATFVRVYGGARVDELRRLPLCIQFSKWDDAERERRGDEKLFSIKRK